MTNGAVSSNKKRLTQTQNPLETLKDLGGSTATKTVSEFKKIGSGIFDQFFGGGAQTSETPSIEALNKSGRETKAKPQGPRHEFSIFNYQNHYENNIVRQKMKELHEQITKEIEFIKKANSSLLSEVADIENLSINSLPEKPGVYHIRFLEVVLSILRSLRAKVGESRTWLAAMSSKRKKRGSLFANLSKKKGTQYSLSQELSSSRSVQ